MKFALFAFRFITPAILLALPLTVTAQQAQASAPFRSQRPARATGPNVQAFALGGPVGVLNDQQRASYEASMDRQRGLMVELQAKLRVAREDFVATSVDQKFDETVMRQKAMAAYGIEAEIAVLRAKALSEVQPPLTAEQIEKIKTGQPGPMRQLRQRQQLEKAAPQAPSAITNQDVNGLPPKK
jgi:Spy/CpxP family protein refolding chaperone